MVLAAFLSDVICFHAFAATPPPNHTQALTFKVGPDFHAPSGYNRFTSWRIFYTRVGPWPDYAVIQSVEYAGGYFTPPVPPEGSSHPGSLQNVLTGTTMRFQWADGDVWAGAFNPDQLVWYDCTPSFAVAAEGSNPEIWFPDAICLTDVLFNVQPLAANGTSRSQASVASTPCFPNGARWDIIGPSLGCTISSNGVVTAGEVSGRILVRATDALLKTKVATGSLELRCGDTCNGCGANSKVANKSVDVRIELGDAEFGKLAGYLHIKTNLPSTALATPDTNILRFHAASTNWEEVIISAASGERQYKTPNMLAWIKTNSVYNYTIKLYTNASLAPRPQNYGAFALTNSPLPFMTWEIENPDGATSSNKLNVTEARFGQTIVYNYQYLGSGWELSMYDGGRKETRLTTSTNAVDSETYTITEGTNNVVRYQTVRTYYNFPWGRELTNEVIGTGANALTNTWTFYQSTNDGNNYTYLKRKTDPYGKWELYGNYDSQGRVGVVVQQFKDNAEPSSASTNDSNNRLTIATYRTNAPYEEILVKLKGQEIEHRYRAMDKDGLYDREILAQCQSRNITSWTDAGNLMQTNWTYSVGHASFPSRPQKTRYPDGTMAFFSYFSTNGLLATVVKKGTPDAAGTSIVQGKGTRTVTKADFTGNLLSEEIFASIESDDATQRLYKKEGSNPDDFGRRTRFAFLDGTFEATLFGCCGSKVVTNRSGLVTTNQYDDFRRLSSVSSSTGVTTAYDYDVAGRLSRTTRIGTDSSLTYLNRLGYDDAGRLIKATNALGHVSSVSENVVTREKTITFPNNSTRIEARFTDGSRKRLYGTAVHELEYDYGADADGEYTKEIRVRGTAKDEWVTTYRDVAGRNHRTVYPINGGLTALSQSFYNSKGQLSKTLDPDSVTNLFEYSDQGELKRIAIDLNNNEQINDSVDRVTQTTNTVTTREGTSTLVRRRITKVWDDISGTSTEILAAIEDVSADESDRWLTRFGQTNQTHIAYDAGNRRVIITETAPDLSKTLLSYLDDRLQFVARTNSAGGQISKVTFTYDPHGRVKDIIDARNGTNTFAYYDDDRVSSNTSPLPGFGDTARQVTTYQYNDLNLTGPVETITNPDGTSVINEYYLTGELKKTSGARTYQVEYTYEQGRIKTMKTWTDISAGSSATTTWSYTTNRGFLDRKTYNDGKYTSYEYSKAGRLTKRTWARGVVADFKHNPAGDLAQIDYSDIAGNPDVTYAYNRRGLPTTITDPNGTRILNYFLTNSVLAAETNTSGALSGLAVSHHYDSLLRRDYVEILGAPQTVKHQYDYDTASRMSKVYEGTNTHVTYAYHTDSPLLQTTSFRRTGEAGAVVMTRTNNYDYLNRLKDIASVASNTISFAYQYNSANQRTRATLQDSSYWSYGYDSLGQVTSGIHHWSDTSPVAGQQFAYTFDHIGNRAQSQSGGDQWGVNRRFSDYTPNQLNQYTSRKVPGSADIIGTAHASATVTVDNAPTQRKADYFRANVPVNNSAGPVFRTNIIRGVRPEGTNDVMSEETRTVLLPPQTQGFTYDDDGNLLTDGIWGYTWDAENRLTQITNLTSVTANDRRKLLLTYDYLARRQSKKVYPWSGSDYSATAQTDLKFLYDGWNLIAELDSTNGILRSYIWGTDASGTTTGAGGVGGLLAMRVHSGPNAGTYFYVYDGNHNIVALVNAATGASAAEYIYGPFGELLRATGPLAFINPFRFSTKYCDDETGLIYYQFRYYNPDRGVWLNRDPIGEAGGLHVYGFVNNNPLMYADSLGLQLWYDQFGQWFQNRVDVTKQATLEAQGVAIATIINTSVDVANLFAQLPQLLGHLGEATGATGEVGNEPLFQPISHLGEGAGTFSGNPTLENSAGLFQDISVAAGILSAVSGSAPALSAELLPIYRRLYSERTKAFRDLYQQGKICVPPGITPELHLGRLIDTAVRKQLREILNQRGIVEGPGQNVQVNRRLYDPSGSGEYVLPDVYFPEQGIAFEGTTAHKTQSTPQIVKIHKFSNGGRIIIVRPKKL